MWVTRPLFLFWGHIPQTPCQGASPPGPPRPPPLALGLPAFWVPLVAGLLMWATRSLFCLSGGTPPTPPARGLCPLDPLCPPPLADGLPAFWVPLVAGLLMWATRSLFCFCGGTPPRPPPWGLRPPGPPLPTPVGLGFASVLGPTRRLTFPPAGRTLPNFPPSLARKGVRGLGQGFCPLAPLFCPPPLAGGLPAFWVPLGAGLAGVGNSPYGFKN